MEEYPNAKLVPPLDAINDLLGLDVGPIYRKFEESDAERKIYVRLHPAHGRVTACTASLEIGALNAESFCERSLRCAGHVLTEGNSLLGHEEL